MSIITSDDPDKENDDAEDDILAGEDFDESGFGDDLGSEFEDFDTGGDSLADIWRNNPAVKLVVIGIGLLTVIGGIILFGGGSPDPNQSSIRGGRNVGEAPGAGDVSPAYREAVQDKNRQGIDDAVRDEGSFIPIPVDGPDARLNLPGDDVAEEDPLERWRRIQEARQREQQEFQPPPKFDGPDPRAETIDALANAMAAQMESILATLEPRSPQTETVANPKFIEQEREAAAAKERERQEQNGELVNEDGEPLEILLPAGTIEYAQLMTQANSDANGPILAQIVSGPLAGSRMLGSFQTEEEFLVLNFNQIVIDGISHPTSAVALDPNTANVGMVTDIDKRYFRRIILPAAAAFVEGLGGAIADSGTSTTTINGATSVSQTQTEDLDLEQELFAGVEEAANRVSDVLDEEGRNTQPLIIVDAGTPMGILFTQPVLEEDTNTRSKKGGTNAILNTGQIPAP